MIRKHLFFSVLVIIVFLLTACASTPTEEPTLYDEVMDAGKIVCATSADFPPYEFIDEAGDFAGFDMELMAEIAAGLGVDLEIQDMGFDSIIASIETGKIDCAIAALAVTPDREEKVDFTIKYKVITDAFVVRDDNDDIVEINGPEETGPYTVACQAGGGICRWMLANMVETGKMPKENLFQYERMDQALLDLQAGRVEVLITHLETAGTYIDADAGVKIVGESPCFSGDCDMAVAIPDGEQELKSKLDEVISALIADGTRNDLMRKWNIPIPAGE